MYICIYVHMYMCVCVCVYTQDERRRQRAEAEIERILSVCATRPAGAAGVHSQSPLYSDLCGKCTYGYMDTYVANVYMGIWIHMYICTYPGSRLDSLSLSLSLSIYAYIHTYINPSKHTQIHTHTQTRT